MRNFKRFLTLALAVVMLVSTFAFSTSAQFTDVDENNEYLVKAVNLLSYLGVTKGTSETTFGTDDLVTREQMAAFIYRLMKKGNSVEGGTNTSLFTDLEDPTFFFMVSWANNQGIIKGTSETTFNPKGNITLQDAYTMLVRALSYETKEEPLSYPFDYIEIAEQEGVELDEGLASDVTYADYLTRGDVAILLYNAFFAETGVADTKQVEQQIGGILHVCDDACSDPCTEDEYDVAPTWVLKTVTDYPTLCEKVYDVLEVEYQAVATPKWASFSEGETTASLGYDAVLFDYVEGAETNLALEAEEVPPAQFYAAVEDLAVENADDYILSHFTMYLIVEDGKVDEILYAEPLMTKKTVSEFKFETVSTNNANSYYTGSEAKRLSGKVLADGEAIYFYNAPYNYAKPTYATGASEAAKYVARNAKNPQFIQIWDVDVDENEFKYVGTDLGVTDLATILADTSDTTAFAAQSEALANALAQAYVGGAYEADLFDVNGDGLYDYINYMPYDIAEVDVDDDYDYASDKYTQVSGSTMGTIYTNEVVAEGAKFEDEDLILGYFAPNANYIRVATVLEPVTAKVDNFKLNAGTVALSTGETVSAIDGWKYASAYALDLAAINYDIAGLDYSDWQVEGNLLSAAAIDADEAEFYIYDGAILWQEGIDAKVVLDSNLVIITTNKDGVSAREGAWDVNAEEIPQYVYAWVNGALKWIPVDLEAKVYAHDGSDFVTIEDVISGNDVAAPYLNTVATYTVDSNGYYTIKLLANTYKDEALDKYTGLSTDLAYLENEEDDTLQVYADGFTGYLVKKTSSRFALQDDNGVVLTEYADDDTTPYTFNITKDTQVIIRSEYTDDGETVLKYHVLKEADLKETITNELSNIQFVVCNNVNTRNREDLVLLYAETSAELDYAGTATKKDERFVKSWEPVKNADGDFYIEYTLYNPYTAKFETALGDTKDAETSPFALGDLVVIDSAGEVDESQSVTETIAATGATTEGYYWILDYDANDKFVEVAPIGDEDASFTLYVEDAVVSQIGAEQSRNGANMITYSTPKALSLSDLGSDAKSLKAVNTRFIKEEGADYSTVYGKYIKAYINFEWENDADHTEVNEDTGCNGEASFFVVITNNNEDFSLCKTPAGWVAP